MTGILEALLFAVLVHLVANWPAVWRWITKCAVNQMPRGLRERYAEEFASVIEDTHPSWLGRFRRALGFYWASLRIARRYRTTASTKLSRSLQFDAAVAAAVRKALDERELSLHLLATKDALTGLYNRRGLDNAIADALDQRRPCSLVMVDLDNFKRVNDERGHIAGDHALKAFAQHLQRAVGSRGQLGRVGGDEFLIVLPGTSRNQAMDLAEGVRLSWEAANIALLAFTDGTRVTASFGVALSSDTDTPAQLLSKADTAVYTAKDAGRNRVASAE